MTFLMYPFVCEKILNILYEIRAHRICFCDMFLIYNNKSNNKLCIRNQQRLGFLVIKKFCYRIAYIKSLKFFSSSIFDLFFFTLIFFFRLKMVHSSISFTKKRIINFRKILAVQL